MPDLPVIGSWTLLPISEIGAYGGATWPSGNLAIFVPFVLESQFVVTKMIWMNGAAVSGNVDAGIYAMDGTRLVSTGSTAQAGTNTAQSVDVSITLDAGEYYIALAMNNTTGTQLRNTGLEPARAGGVLQMASAFPLPATATFAALSNSYVPLVSMTSRSFV